MARFTKDDLYDENGDLHETYQGLSDGDLEDEVDKMNEFGDDYFPPQENPHRVKF